MKNSQNVFNEARKKKEKKGSAFIEFCKDKCWNASPYWMQLAVGSFHMRIIMKNRKQTEVSHICIVCALISPCDDSSRHVQTRLSGLFTLTAKHVISLHTHINIRARGLLCC